MRFFLSLGGVLAALMLTACATSAQAPIEEPIAKEAVSQPASQESEPVVADAVAAEPAVVADADVAAEPEPIAEPAAVTGPVAVQGPGNSAKPTKLMMLGAMGGGEVFDTFADLSPELRVVVASASGGLDAQATQRVVNMALDNFEMCANMATAHKSKGPNTVDLTFRISPNGSTSAITAKGPEKFAAKCVKKLIRKLQFEENEKATKVIAKISFRRPLDPFAELGAGGIGLGSGSGVAGLGHGTIGLGNYGSIGHGSGTGSGYGSLNNKGARRSQVRAGKPVTKGDLDKDVIRRVIRRKLPRIRYCYEKALLKQPTLAGTVRTEFVISPSGSVTQTEVKGFDALVDACIATTLRSMQFPKPRGGGSVTVRYPFTFAPSK